MMVFPLKILSPFNGNSFSELYAMSSINNHIQIIYKIVIGELYFILNFALHFTN